MKVEIRNISLHAHKIRTWIGFKMCVCIAIAHAQYNSTRSWWVFFLIAIKTIKIVKAYICVCVMVCASHYYWVTYTNKGLKGIVFEGGSRNVTLHIYRIIKYRNFTKKWYFRKKFITKKSHILFISFEIGLGNWGSNFEFLQNIL